MIRFNELLNPPKRVEFMEALIMEMIDRTQMYAIEPYIIGEYTKHSNNVGFIDFEHWRNTPHAFSHFTYEFSRHTELVCDIQGCFLLLLISFSLFPTFFIRFSNFIYFNHLLEHYSNK